MKTPRLRLVADVTNHYEELIQSKLSDQSMPKHRNSPLQGLVSVVKFIAERGLTFRDDENVGSHRNFFKTNFKNRKCDASGDRFCNSFSNR